MSEVSIEKITKSDSNFEPTFVDHHLLPEMNFNRHYLIKNNISIPKKVINLFISYRLCPQVYLQMEATEKMSLFLELIWPRLCMLIIREKIF